MPSRSQTITGSTRLSETPHQAPAIESQAEGGGIAIELACTGRACLDRGHGAALPQHRDATGKHPHLAQVVRDEQHTGPGAGDTSHELVHTLPLDVREEAGRLVEDEQDGRLRGRSRDGEKGAVELAQPVHPRVEVEVEAEPGQRLARPPALMWPGDPAPVRRGELVEAHVLEHAERGDQAQLLVDEAQPERPCPGRVERQPDGAAGDRQVAARRGSVIARQHLHERGLAGAVGAHQAVHLATLDGDRDARERAPAAEALRDPPRLDGDYSITPHSLRKPSR
jgi:hypothetical protein